MRRPRKVLVIPKRKDNAKEDLAKLLDKSRVRFEDIETELLGNEVIVWVTTRQEKLVKEALDKNNIKSFTSEVVPVKLSTKPGELAKIARILVSAGITLKDTHLILKSRRDALYGFMTNRPRETAKIIAKLELLKNED